MGYAYIKYVCFMLNYDGCLKKRTCVVELQANLAAIFMEHQFTDKTYTLYRLRFADKP